MTLDLKRVFLGENERIALHTEVDMGSGSYGETGFVPPVEADITVRNRAGLVEFEADVSFTYRFECDRCAKAADRSYAYKFRHIIVEQLSDESGDDHIEAPDYKLDTVSLLRDDILLELPSKFLCKESCKGLCPKCGKNLNEGKCSCSEKETDPRLAVLKQLLSE